MDKILYYIIRKNKNQWMNWYMESTTNHLEVTIHTIQFTNISFVSKTNYTYFNVQNIHEVSCLDFNTKYFDNSLFTYILLLSQYFFFVKNVPMNALRIKIYVISKLRLLSARILKKYAVGSYKSEYSLPRKLYYYFFFFLKKYF